MPIKSDRPKFVLIPSAENTILKQVDVKAYVHDKSIGDGTLYLAKESMVWVAETEREAFEIYYSELNLQLVDPEPGTFLHQNIYMSVDAKKNNIGQVRFAALDKDNTVEYDDESSYLTTVRLVPTTVDLVHSISHAIDEAKSESNKCPIQ